MTSIHQVSGNRLLLLQSGGEFFPQLCADIDAAMHSVYLETYIFAADETGRMIADALRGAALRGVIVRLLMDGFGSAELPQYWVDELQAAGVEVQWFRREISPFTLRRSRRRRLFRLHRKLAVMDGQIAFVGGINIIDDIPASGDSNVPRLDYAVRVEGTVAGEIHADMRHLWGMVSWASFHRRGKEIRRFVRDRAQRSTVPEVSFVVRDNMRHRRDIEHAYLLAIALARHEIIIANAYFLPGHAFLRALEQAARRGVRVMLLLQGKVEYRLQHYATHALYERLLASGVEIHEYQASYLHAKVAVIDGEWVTVGSSNIDPFSLLLAREANLVVRDAGFAGGVRMSLLDAISSEAIRIGERHGAASNWLERMMAHISYGIVRLLLGMIGYRGHGT